MDKRFLIFIVLSVGILYFTNGLFMKSAKNTQKNVNIAHNEQINEENSVKDQINLKEETKVPVKELKKTKQETKREEAKISSEYLEIEADSLGAKINQIKAIRYIKNQPEKIDLIENTSENNAFILAGIVDNTPIKSEEINWKIVSSERNIKFINENNQKIRIKKSLQIKPEKYLVQGEIEIENTVSDIVEIKDLKIFWGPDKTKEKNRFNIKQIVLYDKGKDKKIKPAKKSETITLPISSGWAAIKDQYFCAIFYNHQEKFTVADAIRKEDQSLELVIHLQPIKISPGKTEVYQFSMYFGPENYQELSKLGYNLKKVVDFGIFPIIAVPIYYLLKYFYAITHNYGFAIILLTLLIRLILWWPTQKSYTSMKKMQTAMNKMQPRLKTLKEIYKDNPAKLNEETMKLYKEYQINPMGGCLPMLLQMPIFFALYSTLVAAVELKGAGFIWFWKDLSGKDPMFVLPLLMGITMFLQQKMSTPPAATPEAAAQQKMMLYLMPGMLTFFSFMWPSGLLLYWVVSNILSIGQQLIINRKA